MSLYVPTDGYVIPAATRSLISDRYHTLTKAINRELWNQTSDSAHSFYVGSYGRGTAINTSDLDILVEVPSKFYVQYSYTTYNPQSRLLQVIKNALLTSWPKSDIRGDGQVVVVDFFDGMKFEVLPAIPQTDSWGRVTYKYPDTHMGGNWKSTNPKAEQDAMREKNRTSNGLLFDTCKHIRFIRDNNYSSYHLSGIVIDSFVYVAMGNWRHLNSGEGGGAPAGSYEEVLLKYWNDATWNGRYAFQLKAPGSGMDVDTSGDVECLGKVLKKMVG